MLNSIIFSPHFFHHFSNPWRSSFSNRQNLQDLEDSENLSEDSEPGVLWPPSSNSEMGGMDGGLGYIMLHPFYLHNVNIYIYIFICNYIYNYIYIIIYNYIYIFLFVYICIYIYISIYIYIYIYIYISIYMYIYMYIYIYVICRVIKDLKKPTGSVYNVSQWHCWKFCSNLGQTRLTLAQMLMRLDELLIFTYNNPKR